MAFHERLKVYGKAISIGDYYVVSDLHLGYERYLAGKGVFIPSMIDVMIDDILKAPKKDNLLVLGDFKHEFSPKRIKGADKLMKLMKERYKKRILVKGNHDKFIAEDFFDDVVDSIIINGVLFAHGDRIIDVDGDYDTIVIGHEHPAYTLDDGARREKYKCYLKGNFRGKILIVMPSFSDVTIGSDIRREMILSPYVKEAKDVEFYVIGDKLYRFVD